jgi:PilZ domain
VSTSAEQFTGHQTKIHERRLQPRVLPRTLIYVACGESNGGMVLNVSDDGMAISMAIPVGDEAYSNLHVRMNGLPQGIEVNGRMAWTSKSKKRAGIQLVDISAEQRGQIREWLAQEGVRDVNLLPRVSEPTASILPAFAGAAIDKPRSDQSPVAASVAINPEVLPEKQASLLVGFGGTTPEFLGPAQEEPALTEDTIAETPSSQGYKPNFAGFRENEWDLASVTMVPRKRLKPEGLSALALLLLWIAIPSFGIGIIVGRRPLERWLSGGRAMARNISHVPAPQTEIVNARDESSAVTSSDIDATGPRPIPSRIVETPASSQDERTSAATKSFVSTPAFVNTKLLNSMSTQELRALKSPVTIATAENPSAAKLSRVDSGPKLDAGKDASSSAAATAKPLTRPDTFAASTNAPTNTGNASVQRGDSKTKTALAPAIAHGTQSTAVNNQRTLVQDSPRPNPSDQVAKTISVDSGVKARTTNHSDVAASNVPAAHSSALNATPTAVPHSISGSTAAVSSVPANENSTTHQNATGSVPMIQPAGNPATASTQSVNHSVTQLSGTAGNSVTTSSSANDASRNNSTALSASRTQPALAPSSTSTASGPAPSRPASFETTPRIAPNARPTGASAATADTATKAAPSLYAPASSRSVAPSAASNLAPVNAQAPLHGVMLVARKNDQSFLLKLPAESVTAGRFVSVEMQRFVMVPAESRWHRHGPIAKLTVGELLTQVSANQVETVSYARPGDAVTVRAFIDRNGTVQDLKPVSGRFALMPRVMHDVREWQFDQTLIDGKPVESEVNITVEFRSGPPLSRGREIQAQNSFKQ